jgi:hypothetical protein
VNPTILAKDLELGRDSGDAQTYCRYRGVLPGSKVEGAIEKDDYLCIDIQGQNIKPGVPIIS